MYLINCTPGKHNNGERIIPYTRNIPVYKYMSRNFRSLKYCTEFSSMVYTLNRSQNKLLNA